VIQAVPIATIDGLMAVNEVPIDEVVPIQEVPIATIDGLMPVNEVPIDVCKLSSGGVVVG
jgi:hypothetical protein